MPVSYRGGDKFEDGRRIPYAVVRQFNSSNSYTIYETRVYRDNTASCNCPGFANRKYCKHTREALNDYLGAEIVQQRRRVEREALRERGREIARRDPFDEPYVPPPSPAVVRCADCRTLVTSLPHTCGPPPSTPPPTPRRRIIL